MKSTADRMIPDAVRIAAFFEKNFGFSFSTRRYSALSINNLFCLKNNGFQYIIKNVDKKYNSGGKKL